MVQFRAARADTFIMVLLHGPGPRNAPIRPRSSGGAPRRPQPNPGVATFRRRRQIALLSLVTIGLGPWLLSPKNAADAAAAPEPIRAAAATKSDPVRVGAGNLKTAARPVVASVISSAGKVPVRTATAESLAANPRLTLSDNARADLLAGLVDSRLIALLGQALEKHRLEVTVFSTGHSRMVKGTTKISNHVDGRATDIVTVDGTEVSPTNAAARGLIDELFATDFAIRPTELGGPWDVDGPEGVGFTDAGHSSHLHIGYDT